MLFKSLIILSFTLLTLNTTWGKKQDDEILAQAKDIFAPLPDTLIDTKANSNLIALGKKLYFEKGMSANNTISCNSCHQLDKYGVDGQSTSPGHAGKRGDRNSPTVYNAALNFAQFWDGRAKDLEEQALGPILNPIEHGMAGEKDVLDVLEKAQGYKEMFAQAFAGQKNPLTYTNVGAAIGAYEKTLLTPSAFDDFLKGNLNALNGKQKAGLKKFMEVGCTACHNGVNIGGNSYQKIGLVEAYKTSDLGRFKITKNEDDKFFFKVPTLRNIVHTGPYFHDGSVKTLDQAITLMGKHQLGVKLSKADISSIKDFLGSLSAKKLKF